MTMRGSKLLAALTLTAGVFATASDALADGKAAAATASAGSGEQDQAPEMEEEHGGYTPIQLALVAPRQLFSERRTVIGLRINTIYGRNRAVYGIDIGLINDADRVGAIQAGLVNIARESAGGFQIGGFNWTPQMTGAQIGGFNYAGTVRGGQMGGVNIAKKARGFQIGLVNVTTQHLRGVQLGGLNYARNAWGLGFMPLVNSAF
jgi:hypothetical protein